MAINIIEAAKIAKARTTDKRWLNAIDRAVEGASTWIVTELHDCLLITSDSGETYRVNGSCNCRAGQLGQPCKHLALRRLREIAATEMAPAPRITRSNGWYGQRSGDAMMVDGWLV